MGQWSREDNVRSESIWEQFRWEWGSQILPKPKGENDKLEMI